MAVTIHLPQVHRPSMRRIAGLGVAALAAVVAVAGIQAIADNTGTTGSTDGDVVEATTVDTVNQAPTIGAGTAGDAFTARNEFLKASGSSVAAATEVAAPVLDTAAQNLWAQFEAGILSSDTTDGLAALGVIPATDAIGGSIDSYYRATGPEAAAPEVGGSGAQASSLGTSVDSYYRSTVPATETTTHSGGFDTVAEFLEANDGANASVTGSTVSHDGLGSVLAIDYDPAAIFEANDGSYAGAAIPEATNTHSGGFDTVAEFLEANDGSYAGAAIPEATNTHSGGFDTVAEFLEANDGS